MKVLHNREFEHTRADAHEHVDNHVRSSDEYQNDVFFSSPAGPPTDMRAVGAYLCGTNGVNVVFSGGSMLNPGPGQDKAAPILETDSCTSVDGNGDPGWTTAGPASNLVTDLVDRKSHV